MKLTNDRNLPEVLANALGRDEYNHHPGRVSVTALINPAKISVLTRRHMDEITEDVSDRLWIFLGNAVHSLLDKYSPDNSLSEERLSINMGNLTVTGKPDLYHDGIIYDYKYTSAWSLKFDPNGKKEWCIQLNMYAWLLRNLGFEVKALRNICFLRDWSKIDALRTTGYPTHQITIVDQPLFDEATILDYVKHGLSLYEAAEIMLDDDIPECSPEDRWDRPTKWAVMKTGQKKAVKLFDNNQEADVFLKKQDDKHYIQIRPGVSVRCMDYCPVRQFCHYGRTLKEEGEE